MFKAGLSGGRAFGGLLRLRDALSLAFLLGGAFLYGRSFPQSNPSRKIASAEKADFASIRASEVNGTSDIETGDLTAGTEAPKPLVAPGSKLANGTEETDPKRYTAQSAHVEPEPYPLLKAGLWAQSTLFGGRSLAQRKSAHQIMAKYAGNDGGQVYPMPDYNFDVKLGDLKSGDQIVLSGEILETFAREYSSNPSASLVFQAQQLLRGLDDGRIEAKLPFCAVNLVSPKDRASNNLSEYRLVVSSVQSPTEFLHGKEGLSILADESRNERGEFFITNITCYIYRNLKSKPSIASMRFVDLLATLGSDGHLVQVGTAVKSKTKKAKVDH